MSNRPSHEAVVDALRDMIELAEHTMDIFTGSMAAGAEEDIQKAKQVLAELENS